MSHQCIAISGKSGCGNTSVSKLLAENIGYKHINFTFRNLAIEMEIPLEALLAKASLEPEWDRELDRHQVQLAAAENSVVGSRLAIWLLREKAFTVYLDAPLELRSHRLAGREGKPLSQALSETSNRDAQDQERFATLYGFDTQKWDFAHLAIDVSQLSISDIATRIEIAFKQHLRNYIA